MNETRTMALELSSALHPRVALLHAQMEGVRADLKSLIAKLDPKQLEAAPVPEFFTPAALLGHVAETEAWWVQVVLQDRGEAADPRRLRRGWCAPFDEEEGGEPKLGARPLTDYVELLDRIRGASFEYLKDLGAEDLSREYPYTSKEGVSYRFQLEWVLQHLVEHEAHHRGQLVLLHRLLAP